MMHCEDVNFLVRHNSVNNSTWPENDLSDPGIRVLGNRATRLRKVLKSIDGVQKPPDDDVGVMRRVDFNKGPDRCKIRLRALSPEERGHARKRFFTSS